MSNSLFSTILLSILFLSYQETAFAQLFYLGGGYNVSVPKDNGLDNIIDEYNDSRGFLSKDMNNINRMGGPAIMAGVGIKKIFLEFSWVGRHRTVSAEGIDNSGLLQERNYKLQANSFNFGLGVDISSSRHVIGPIVSVDFGKVKSSTRAGPENEIKNIDFSEIDKDNIMGMTFMFNIMLISLKAIGIALRPYYQLRFSKVDFSEVNISLNPNTYQNVNTDLDDPLSNFGVQLALVLGWSK